jgi:hypothetical protein
MENAPKLIGGCIASDAALSTPAGKQKNHADHDDAR